MNVIKETKEYGMFELHDFNRDIRIKQDLIDSMKDHGWIDAYPVHCVRGKGGKLIVKDGHHRIVIAQKIGIPVKYVVCDDHAPVYFLPKCVNIWRLEDFLTAYSRMGRPDYLEVQNYCKRTGVKISAAVSMFGGHWAGSHNQNTSFKDGSFKIKDRKYPSMVSDIIKSIVDENRIQITDKLVKAISRIVFVQQMDVEKLIKKVNAHSYLLKRQGSIVEYLQMLESIYNRQSSDKLHLAQLADDMAAKRNGVKKKHSQIEQVAMQTEMRM